MRDNAVDAKYWNSRFRSRGTVWGEEPSEGAVMTVEFLRRRPRVQRVLDVGCGYGRDVRHFKNAGYDITGVDWSHEAVALSRTSLSLACIVEADVAELPFSKESFDAVYGYYLLHLLLQQQRVSAVKEWLRVLRPKGYLIQIVASTKDADCGRGTLVEPNTYVNARGVPKHFFDVDEITVIFGELALISVEEYQIHHTHDVEHDHYNYFVVAQKT